MKDFVVTKKFDKLGRVVIPKEMRTHYGFTSCVQVIPQKDGVLLIPIKKQSK